MQQGERIELPELIIILNKKKLDCDDLGAWRKQFLSFQCLEHIKIMVSTLLPHVKLKKILKVESFRINLNSVVNHMTSCRLKY